MNSQFVRPAIWHLLHSTQVFKKPVQKHEIHSNTACLNSTTAQGLKPLLHSARKDGNHNSSLHLEHIISTMPTHTQPYHPMPTHTQPYHPMPTRLQIPLPHLKRSSHEDRTAASLPPLAAVSSRSRLRLIAHARKLAQRTSQHGYAAKGLRAYFSVRKGPIRGWCLTPRTSCTIHRSTMPR